jgi:hypothetical protein
MAKKWKRAIQKYGSLGAISFEKAFSCRVRKLSNSSAKSDSCLTLQLAPPSGESCLRKNNYMFIRCSHGNSKWKWKWKWNRIVRWPFIKNRKAVAAASGEAAWRLLCIYCIVKAAANLCTCFGASEADFHTKGPKATTTKSHERRHSGDVRQLQHRRSSSSTSFQLLCLQCNIRELYSCDEEACICIYMYIWNCVSSNYFSTALLLRLPASARDDNQASMVLLEAGREALKLLPSPTRTNFGDEDSCKRWRPAAAALNSAPAQAVQFG